MMFVPSSSVTLSLLPKIFSPNNMHSPRDRCLTLTRSKMKVEIRGL